MEILTLIPARGGSKGIPRKNIRLIANQPVLAYTIQAAQQTCSITRIVVSTDDDEIARVACAYGAEVVLRPAEISGDTASSESALEHALAYLYEKEKYEPDLVVFLQATSPLRQSHDIQAALDQFARQDADSLFSASAFEGFVWKLSGDQVTAINYNPLQRPRRQELDGVFLQENGSIYIFKPWVLHKHHNRLGGKISVYVMDRLDSFQLDEPRDLELVEQLMRLPRTRVSERTLGAIKLLALDFDGVLTDNRALVDQEGKEAVRVNRSDGWGIARLKEAGVRVIVISTETNPIVAARCRKLEIDCFQSAGDKLAVLQEFAAQHQLDRHDIAFVGNDVNDLACLEWVGLPIVVADAHPRVRAIAARITKHKGGDGAVREIADWMLEAQVPRPQNAT